MSLDSTSESSITLITYVSVSSGLLLSSILKINRRRRDNNYNPLTCAAGKNRAIAWIVNRHAEMWAAGAGGQSESSSVQVQVDVAQMGLTHSTTPSRCGPARRRGPPCPHSPSRRQFDASMSLQGVRLGRTSGLPREIPTKRHRLQNEQCPGPP